MIRAGWLPALSALLLAAPALAGQASPPWEGLERRETRGTDGTWVLPAAEFSRYRSVLVEPVQVAFRRDWLRDANATHGVPPIDTEAMERLGRELGDSLRVALVEALRAAGWRVVDAPADDTLRLGAALRDLDVAAPAPQQSPGRYLYVTYAGDARIVVELADGITRQLLAGSVDRRRTTAEGSPRLASDAMTRQDFAQMFERWAAQYAGELGALRGGRP